MARDSSTDLRSRVGELEATVRGLTQELVEADERIRQLEAALEDESRGQTTEPAEPDGGPADDGHKTDTDSGSASSENGSESDELDDIIVA